MFKFNLFEASRNLEKAVPLGPNGIFQNALIQSLTLLVVLIGLALAVKFIDPAIFQQYKPVFRSLVLLPLFWLVYLLSIGTWRYLFRLANYVQTLRDFSVPNIEHMRLRLAELTPPSSGEQTQIEPPVPADRVPLPMDQDGESLRTRERNTLVALIGVLCREEGIDYSKPAAAAATIKNMTASHGLSIGESTIEGIMKKIPQAIEARSR